jgi:tetratricopeptide (TPR) repeat protein
MKTIDFSYFIERYNAGEMNEAEKAWFRKELGDNENLRDEVSLRQKADMVIKDHDIISLRNKLSAIEKRRAETLPGNGNRKHMPLTRAAVFAGIILAGSLAFIGTRNIQTEEIFDRFYNSYEVTANLRSMETHVNSDFAVAIDYYNIKDYRSAALCFSKVPDSDPKYMESTMLYGVSEFEEMNFPEAKQSFEEVISNNDNLFLEDANWYLALCHLKTGDKESAITELTSIKKSRSIYSSDARKILRRIK